MSDHHDEITTLPSYLEEQDALEQEAAAELPLECTVCTYEFGSIKQEVYQCITCQEETRITNGIEKGAENGICYACHIMCHADHQVQEIGMKRGWTCDCGTEKIGKTTITLIASDHTVEQLSEHSRIECDWQKKEKENLAKCGIANILF